MRNFTNLLWPEGPFGADLRPFGKPSQMLAAFAVDWSADRLPVGAGAVYLRIKRAGIVDVLATTMNPGLAAVGPQARGDVQGVIEWLDRGLVRARRHAAVLAGHDLAGTLALVTKAAERPLPGLDGVSASWSDRSDKERGMARMVDTHLDLDDPEAMAGRLSVPLGNGHSSWPEKPDEVTDAAMSCLVRCLAIGLAAAWHVEAYRWDEDAMPLRVEHAVVHAAWDTFGDRVPVAG